MKFFRNLLAATLGSFVALGLIFIVTISIIGSLTPQKEIITVEPESVLKIDLSTTFAEQTVKDDLNLGSLMPSIPLVGSTEVSETLGIRDAINTIDKAATDPNIKYILITNLDNAVSDISYFEEIRNALERFRNSGKPIIAYGENFSLKGYYIATVADKIYSDNMASNTIVGLSGTIMYLKDILSRVGIEMQLIRHGKYKSAGEQFIASEMSDANYEQMISRLNSTWNHIAGEICASREISQEYFDGLINDLKINTPEQMLEHKLIDVICSKAEFNQALCEMSNIEDIKDLKTIALEKYASVALEPNVKAKEKIAVIYADGEINVAGEGITAKKFVPIIEKVRKDSTIKAVVLRVNSPGGAVQPAEQIRAELELLQQVKPLIVSYGTMAASGGYWISAAADKIYCNSTAITGSIGVFSMIPSAEKAFKNTLHINPETVSTHKHSGMMSLTKSLDKAEKESIQDQIELIYTKFINIVAEGREMTPERVDEIAQGRVWSGDEGLQIKLVDEIGGINDAISYAAICSDLQDYKIVEYPKVEDSISKLLKKANDAEEAMAIINSPEKMIEKLFSSVKNYQGTYARIPYIFIENN